MTASPTADVEPGPDKDERAVPEDDVVHPLSAFIHGTLTIHFDGGAAVTREASQFDARGFLAKQSEAESSDAVAWETRSWFHWASDRVVFSSFDADRDQNWSIRVDDRHRLAKAGHHRGVVTSLVEFWESRDQRPEPLYSIRAIALLHQVALSGLDRSGWIALARAYEGERGAALLARIYRAAQGQESTPADVNVDEKTTGDGLVDNDAQPNGAPDESSRPDDAGAESDETAPADDAPNVVEPLDPPRDADSCPDDD